MTSPARGVKFRFPRIAGSPRIECMPRMTPLCRCLLLLVSAAALIVCPADGVAQNRSKGARRTRDVASFRKQLGEKHDKFAAGLEELAGDCDEKKLPEAAASIRALARPVDSSE